MATLATARRFTARALFVCVPIVVAAFAGSAATAAARESGRGFLPAHTATAQPHRANLRAEHARHRVVPPFACALAGPHRLFTDTESRHLPVAAPRPRSLDPVHVESGRSPPLRFS